MPTANEAKGPAKPRGPESQVMAPHEQAVLAPTPPPLCTLGQCGSRFRANHTRPRVAVARPLSSRRQQQHLLSRRTTTLRSGVISLPGTDVGSPLRGAGHVLVRCESLRFPEVKQASHSSGFNFSFNSDIQCLQQLQKLKYTSHVSPPLPFLKRTVRSGAGSGMCPSQPCWPQCELRSPTATAAGL